MSFNFAASYPGAPVVGSPADKQVMTKAIKLTFADFTTGGTAAVKAVMPKDASIIGFRLWNKTVLSGNGITAATLSIGVSGTATKYVNAVSALGASGAFAFMATGIGNIMQDAGVETGDVRLLFTGTATTGNPTAGEMYVLIDYVR